MSVKPTLTGTEPTDVAHYASAHPTFPHESTGDQFFDEAQFESYRRLGDFVATSALAPALERAGTDPAHAARDALGLHESDIKERLLVELRHQWVAPITGLPQRFAMLLIFLATAVVLSGCGGSKHARPAAPPAAPPAARCRRAAARSRGCGTTPT